MYLFHRLAILLTLAMFYSVAVHAAELEEVIVVAQHKEENLQEVPIAVTALGADRLEKSDIFDAATIAQNVPNLAFAEFAPGQSVYALRGISSVDDGAGLDNSVALFLDGVYIGRQAGINFDMFDLERIEVLRGPQGTLFGRNAIGGAINVVTRAPSDEFTYKASLTAGNESIIRYQGYVSGEISEGLTYKLVVNHRSHGGFVRNIALNKDQQDEDQTSLRGQLLWQGATSSWLLGFDSMSDEREDMGRTPISPGLAGNHRNNLLAHQLNGGGVRIATSPFDGFSKRGANGVSLQGNIDMDKGGLTLITALRNADTDWEMASNGIGLGATKAVAAAGTVPVDEVIDDIVEDISTLSLEARWTSDLDGSFNYTAGVYFFTEETERAEQFKLTAASMYNTSSPIRTTAYGSSMLQTFRLLSPNNGQRVVGSEYGAGFNETTSYALYAQATYDFSDSLSIDFGGRFTNDSKDYRALTINCGHTTNPVYMANPQVCGSLTRGSLRLLNETFDVRTDNSWSNFSPKATLNYQLAEDKLVYFGIARGFKSGGYAGSQGVSTAAIRPVEQEIATNYELGFKGDFGTIFRLNATVFNIDYQDLQVVRFGPVPNSTFGTFLTTNIGEATISGAELEWTYFMTDNLRFDGFYAYLDTQTKDLIIPTTSGNRDVSGGDLRQAPETSYRYALNYTLGALNANLSFSHTGEQLNDYVDLRTRIDAFNLLDAYVEYDFSDNLNLRLWGKNLLGDDYIQHSYVIGPGIIGVWGPPMTVGLSVTFNN